MSTLHICDCVLLSEWVKYGRMNALLIVNYQFQEQLKRYSVYFSCLGCTMYFHLPKTFTIISSVTFVGWIHVSTVTLTPAFFPIKLILAQSITRLSFFNVQISSSESFPAGDFVNTTRRNIFGKRSKANVSFL